jgi:toxin CcdB
MNPSFKVRGSVLVLHSLDMVSVALDLLGESLGSLAEKGQEIVDALAVVSGLFDRQLAPSE